METWTCQQCLQVNHDADACIKCDAIDPISSSEVHAIPTRPAPMAHTPGPWKFHQWNPSKPLEFELTGRRQYTGGDMDHLSVRMTKYGPNDLEAEANMKLIAAAPDLYRQLKIIQERDHHVYCPCEICRAIAKAEGRG